MKSARRQAESLQLSSFSLTKFLTRMARELGFAPVDDTGFERLTGPYLGATAEIGPLSYLDTVSRATVAYLFANIMTKYHSQGSEREKYDAAIGRFIQSEVQCLETNNRLKSDLGSSVDKLSYASIFSGASLKIQRLLGDLDLNTIAEGFGFGPGASFKLPRRQSVLANKFSGKPETTWGNFHLARAAIRHDSSFLDAITSDGGCFLEIVPGNRVTTVPKNYKTDRCIAIEPRMNMYVQKGVGAFIRRRLRSVGIDLDNQSTNQDLALFGAVTGTLATLDLSMASDTVSLELVRLLLPRDWCALIEQSRSPVGVLSDGTFHEYQKVSSMGNGYTFELESLIFWALCSSVADALGVDSRLMSVYGDDLIVPVSISREVIRVLEFAGFSVNQEKSFVDGPIRESCGKHFYDRYEITPFYVRSDITHLSDLFLLHNNLWRWADRCGYDMKDLLAWVRSFAPPRWRKPRLLPHWGDGAFIGTFDEVRPRTLHHFKKRGKRPFLWFEGFYAYQLQFVSRQKEIGVPGRIPASLRLVGQEHVWSGDRSPGVWKEVRTSFRL